MKMTKAREVPTPTLTEHLDITPCLGPPSVLALRSCLLDNVVGRGDTMFTLKLQNIFLCERLIRAGGVEGSEAEQAGEHLPGTTPLLTHLTLFLQVSSCL